jgi:hypothetical protein
MTHFVWRRFCTCTKDDKGVRVVPGFRLLTGLFCEKCSLSPIKFCVAAMVISVN